MSNLLASLGHTGRRRVVLGHTLIHTHKQKLRSKKKKVLIKFTILYWATFIAFLGCTRPRVASCWTSLGNLTSFPCHHLSGLIPPLPPVHSAPITLASLLFLTQDQKASASGLLYSLECFLEISSLREVCSLGLCYFQVSARQYQRWLFPDPY